MKKPLVFLVAFFVCMGVSLNCLGKASAAYFKGWQTVAVPGEAITFQIPPTLEIQSREYRDYAKKAMPNYPDLDAGTVICQQKGLTAATRNPSMRAAFKTYARVVFESKQLDEDSGMVVGQPLNLSAEDLNDFREAFIEQTVAAANFDNLNAGNKWSRFSPAQVGKYHFGEAIVLTAIRQLKNNPEVQVCYYTIFNRNKVHQLTVSYRMQDAAIWCAPGLDLRMIINTLQFYNLDKASMI